MRYLIAVLALAGLVVSCFALREHFRTEPSPCSINERWDCGVVNHSPFAEIAGRSAVGRHSESWAMRRLRALPWRGAGGSCCC